MENTFILLHRANREAALQAAANGGAGAEFDVQRGINGKICLRHDAPGAPGHEAEPCFRAFCASARALIAKRPTALPLMHLDLKDYGSVAEATEIVRACALTERVRLMSFDARNIAECPEGIVRGRIFKHVSAHTPGVDFGEPCPAFGAVPHAAVLAAELEADRKRDAAAGRRPAGTVSVQDKLLHEAEGEGLSALWAAMEASSMQELAVWHLAVPGAEGALERAAPGLRAMIPARFRAVFIADRPEVAFAAFGARD